MDDRTIARALHLLAVIHSIRWEVARHARLVDRSQRIVTSFELGIVSYRDQMMVSGERLQARSGNP